MYLARFHQKFANAKILNSLVLALWQTHETVFRSFSWGLRHTKTYTKPWPLFEKHPTFLCSLRCVWALCVDISFLSSLFPRIALSVPDINTLSSSFISYMQKCLNLYCKKTFRFEQILQKSIEVVWLTACFSGQEILQKRRMYGTHWFWQHNSNFWTQLRKKFFQKAL